jgi:hypothetical protein
MSELIGKRLSVPSLFLLPRQSCKCEVDVGDQVCLIKSKMRKDFVKPSHFGTFVLVNQ